MKRIAAIVGTAALMGLLLWRGLNRPERVPILATESVASSAPTPLSEAEARVTALLDAARAGDIESYLGGFARPLRDRFEREVAERGRSAFADDLRRAASARKGHALFAPEPDGPDAVRITVESVYPDRNERQTYRLAKTADGWLVTEVEMTRGHSPAARFGTPANYEEPEGPPVGSPNTRPTKQSARGEDDRPPSDE
jgi:hypothetical protein